MPKQTRKKNDEETIKNAIEAMENGMTLRQASEAFDVKRSTLSDRRLKLHTKPYGGKTLLTKKEEQIIVNVIEDALKRSLIVKKSSLINYVGDILKNERINEIERDLPSRYKTGDIEKPGCRWFQVSYF